MPKVKKQGLILVRCFPATDSESKKAYSETDFDSSVIPKVFESIIACCGHSKRADDVNIKNGVIEHCSVILPFNSAVYITIALLIGSLVTM